jgi:hypothetical protein
MQCNVMLRTMQNIAHVFDRIVRLDLARPVYLECLTCLARGASRRSVTRSRVVI